MYVEPVGSSPVNCNVGNKILEIGFSRKEKLASSLLIPFIHKKLSRVKIARYVRWCNITLASTQVTTNVNNNNNYYYDNNNYYYY